MLRTRLRCETLMPDFVVPEAHQNDRSSADLISIQFSMVGSYTGTSTPPPNKTAKIGVGACTGMGACMGQYSIEIWYSAIYELIITELHLAQGFYWPICFNI